MGIEPQRKLSDSEKQFSFLEESSEEKVNSETPHFTPTSYNGIVQLPMTTLVNIPINAVETKMPQQVIAPPPCKTSKRKPVTKKAISNDRPISSNEPCKKSVNDNKKKRLLRNRECARECRRRKKEYIASLEDQVFDPVFK
jgi:hypothetical protein